MKFNEDEDCLYVKCNEDEVLRIWNPKGVSITESEFIIKNADKIRWEWYYYGEQKNNDNLLFWELRNKLGIVLSESNSDIIDKKIGLSIMSPALEIC